MKPEIWVADTSALPLLDTRGGPFAASIFREAVVATLPGWRDVSFGARASGGTLAAVALLARGSGGESVPPAGYGGVVASRPLERSEAVAFLELATRERRLRSVRIRSLELDGAPPVGTRFAMASVVAIARAEPPAARYARLARRSLKRAAAAGAAAATDDSADDFWPVYTAASSGWAMRYPEALVRRLVASGSARVDTVRSGEQVLASLLTLVSGSHWMCWLAGQTAEGRQISASYLAYDAVLADAHRAGVPALNLGASVAGGGEFKRHLGATEVAMRQWTWDTVPAAAARRARGAAAAAASVARAARARMR